MSNFMIEPIVLLGRGAGFIAMILHELLLLWIGFELVCVGIAGVYFLICRCDMISIAFSHNCSKIDELLVERISNLLPNACFRIYAKPLERSPFFETPPLADWSFFPASPRTLSSSPTPGLIKSLNRRSAPGIYDTAPSLFFIFQIHLSLQTITMANQ